MYQWAGNGLHAAPNPVSSDDFQRAVFKAAPKRFTIEFLPPTKLGSSYYYGMRIASIQRGDRSSRASISSDESIAQYDVWRKWEDCLWLQDTLEGEYKRSARERRVRLAQGKGVKKFNGMYKQDMASSWESLPPGPEPTSVATDIHAHVPHLTKKSSFFRPNIATIERNQEEYQALIETLMSDDMPALVKEIRATRIITDFFGYWRRDIEFDEKFRKKNPHLAHAPRSSITSSVFSSYFTGPSSSGASLSSFGGRSSKRSLSSTTRPDSITESVVSSSATVASPSTKSRSSLDSAEALRRADRDVRRHSSSSESSTQSEEAVSDSSYTANSSAPKIAEDSPPVKFNHNPQRGPEPPSPIQEDSMSESTHKSPLDAIAFPFQITRRAKAGADRRSNRNCSVYSPPMGNSPVNSNDAACPSEMQVEESWESFIQGGIASADMYLDELDFASPGTKEERASMQSMASVNSVDSAEACIPDRNLALREQELHMPRASVPVSLSDFDIFSESGGQLSRLTLSEFLMLDSQGPRPLSLLPEESDTGSRPETPTAEFNITTPPRRQPQLPSLRIPGNRASYFSITPSPPRSPVPTPPSQLELPSPTDSSFSFATSSVTSESSATLTPGTALQSPIEDESAASATTPLTATSSMYSPLTTPSRASAGTLSLKVSLNTSIIMIRVARDIPYVDLRQRIYNKFVGQEGIPLSHEFEIVVNSRGAAESDVNTVANEAEWRQIEAAFEGSKLLLKVVDATP
ncbi:hypothetical protein D9611_001654 [Ephemerocybe angulata]|uniref:PX domain-containing protein n=1 Tax=Ephemerocybe angulata TaxID=980116 RepID=A0A8H5CJX6_9AGAR|nr:hypothetical protein D9611_001654 [Tulosesus angulatus]